MTVLASAGLLRAFAWARLGLAGALLVTVPLTASEYAPVVSVAILFAVLGVTVASSAAVLLRRTLPQPRRIAALMSALDVVLVTAVVASTGGPRSMYPFLYVLTVTAACVLLSRGGAVAVAAAASVLYAGLVLAGTLLPITYFFETPYETSALEVVTMFLNAATFLVVAIVASGVAERSRVAQRELESRERDLRDLEAFRDLVFDSVGTGLAVLDREHRVTAFNRAAAEITGRATNGLTSVRWPEVAGDGLDMDEIVVALREPSAPSVRRPGSIRRPDGSVIPVQMTFSTLRSAAGARLGLVVACEDVSALRRMEAQMRQADRFATLGRMSANIAHEIRNPLASLSGAVEVLTTAPADETRERLGQIVLKEAERLNGIIREFLEYARPAPLSRTAANVAELVDEVLVLVEHRATPGTLKVVREFPPVLTWSVDRQQFRQVVWNLCLNALEAMPDGGELRVSMAPVDRHLLIRVTDTGEGIASTDIRHIFEPFFSTKSGGTGLGLAMVHRIVQDHGGDIDVHSRPGAGSAFTLTIPDSNG